MIRHPLRFAPIGGAAVKGVAVPFGITDVNIPDGGFPSVTAQTPWPHQAAPIHWIRDAGARRAPNDYP